MDLKDLLVEVETLPFKAEPRFSDELTQEANRNLASCKSNKAKRDLLKSLGLNPVDQALCLTHPDLFGISVSI